MLMLKDRPVALVGWISLAVTGFVVFRVLDIWKPGPARWAEQHFPGGLGVMLDDVVAGLFGAVVMALVVWGAMFAGGLF
jgi:phosphatidylglycerophosphatase A